MTLGQFSVAVGAAPRWVLNALTRLKIPRRYNEPLACRLALARLLSETTGSAMGESLALATRALHNADPHSTWRSESLGGAITITIDMPRFFTAYGARLALSVNTYGEMTRGRKPNRRRSAVTRAREYGVDTTLIDSQLRRTMAQRVSEHQDRVEDLKALRAGSRKGFSRVEKAERLKG